MTPADLFEPLPECVVCGQAKADRDIYELDRYAVCGACCGLKIDISVRAITAPLSLRPEVLERIIEAHADVVALHYANGIAEWRWSSDWPGVAA